MFFLLRMAFWLGLVLVLLPTDKSSDSDKGPQIGASEAISAATAAVSDMSQFCTRQPAACEVGGQAAVAIEALDAGATGAEKSFYEGKIAVASFFAKNMLPQLTSTRAILDNVDNDIMELDEAAF